MAAQAAHNAWEAKDTLRRIGAITGEYAIRGVHVKIDPDVIPELKTRAATFQENVDIAMPVMVTENSPFAQNKEPEHDNHIPESPLSTLKGLHSFATSVGYDPKIATRTHSILWKLGGGQIYRENDQLTRAESVNDYMPITDPTEKGYGVLRSVYVGVDHPEKGIDTVGLVRNVEEWTMASKTSRPSGIGDRVLSFLAHYRNTILPDSRPLAITNPPIIVEDYTAAKREVLQRLSPTELLLTVTEPEAGGEPQLLVDSAALTRYTRYLGHESTPPFNQMLKALQNADSTGFSVDERSINYMQIWKVDPQTFINRIKAAETQIATDGTRPRFYTGDCRKIILAYIDALSKIVDGEAA